jgi:MOSC domain-containing protein YiiM
MTEQARVEAIFIAPEETAPIERVAEVKAAADAGLVGDRYHSRAVTGRHDPTEDITLFAKEAVDEANAETDLALEYHEMRRNILTSGIELDATVGSRLMIGEVEVEVLELNPACRYLQDLAGKPLLKAMVHRGGVRGRIVTSGTIREGDPIRAL